MAKAESEKPLPDLDQFAAMGRLCLSTNLRRTERLVTRHYDAYLAAAGVTAVQFPILANIAAAREPTFRTLAGVLELDRSTLSRNLALLDERGLVKVGPSAGRKAGRLSLTRKGRVTLGLAYTCWLEAHEALAALLSNNAVAEGLQFLKLLRHGARHTGDGAPPQNQSPE